MLAPLALAILSFQQVQSETQSRDQENGSLTQLFGASVACSRFTDGGGGYTVAVGAPLDDNLGTNRGAVYLYENGNVVALNGTSVPADGDESGQVALDQNTLVVSAWKAEAGAFIDVGAVTIFERNSSNIWNEVARYGATIFQGVGGFVLSDFDQFGAIDIHEDRIIVGSRLADAGGLEDSGAAFLLERNGSSWAAIPTVKRLDPGPGTLRAGDNFGSVAVYGDYAVVGARRHDSNPLCDPVSSPFVVEGCDQGAAFTFLRNNSAPGAPWQLQTPVIEAQIQPAAAVIPDGGFGDEFGFSVSIFDNLLVVGAPGKDVGCGAPSVSAEVNCESGAVYVYERLKPSTTWTFKTRLLTRGLYRDGASGIQTGREPTAFERFGYSVAVHGGRVVVGAPGRFMLPVPQDGSTIATGASYLFERNPNDLWQGTRFLSEFDVGGLGESGAFFGSSVAASSNVVCVGAPFDSSPGSLLAGKAYTFYQLPEVGISEHVSMCFGDRPPGCVSCPCGNDAPPGSIGGCANSASGSVRLVASGRASVTSDSLRFEALGVVASSTTFGVLFAGNAAAPQMTGPCMGQGVVLLDPMSMTPTIDGMRCLTGGTFRVASRPLILLSGSGVQTQKASGIETRGFGPPDNPPGGIISFLDDPMTLNAPSVSGTQVHFQLFYRDFVWTPAGSSTTCAVGINTSNAVQVTYVP